VSIRWYTLDEKGNPVACGDLMDWARRFEDMPSRIVKQEKFLFSKISTVFLGLDHRFGEGPPILWETMVFGGPMNHDCNRCSGNREQAEAMHARTVVDVKKSYGLKSLVKYLYNKLTKS